MEVLAEPPELAHGVVLHDDGEHRFIWLGLLDRDADHEVDESVQVNQYAVEHRGRVALLDPGSVLTFPHVIAALCRHVGLDQVEALFFSHQDPDVASGISLWMQVTRARSYLSRHWVRFVPHFGHVDAARLAAIPDAGGTLPLGGCELRVLPAHFMHSIANFCVFDPISRILFTGDIGASILEPESSLFVDDIRDHLPLMEPFHRRYMVSNAACRRWVSMVRDLGVETLATQHGALLRGPAVGQFLAWLEQLECGVDRLDEIHGGR